MSTDDLRNQGGAEGCSTGDAVFSAWRTAFCASGGSPAEWEHIKGSSALSWALASGRDRFWADADRSALGRVWDDAEVSVQGSWFNGLRQDREWRRPVRVPRLPGWAGAVPPVVWMSPRWSNARLGAEGTKWEAALAAQSSGFDAGFARATGEDKSGIARWSHSYVRSTEHLYVSWIWELYVDLAGRTGGWVEGLGSVRRDGPPPGPGRAAWMEAHPGGLDLPPGSVLWHGDPVGHGARVPFCSREARADEPRFAGLSVVCVPSTEIVSASASPVLSGSGLVGSPSHPVFVSRASGVAELWDDVVRLGAASLRPGLFEPEARVVLVLPRLTAEDLHVAWATVGLAWRVGMVLPLREIAGHVQAVGRGGTREVPCYQAPESDWAGALRLLADARFRVAGSRPVEGPGCLGYVSAFASCWKARVAAVVGLLGVDDPYTEGPTGNALDSAVSMVGYETARWTDRAVQRILGHGENLGLVARGGSLYRALVRAVSLLPGLHLHGDAARVRVLPVLGYCLPKERAPRAPPDRWKVGVRADWSGSVEGGPADPWADLTPETPLPKGRGGGLAASAWEVEPPLRDGLGPSGSALTRAWASGRELAVVGLPRGGAQPSVLALSVEAAEGVEPCVLPFPVELFRNEATSVAVVGASLRDLWGASFSCPGGAAFLGADALEGLSF